MHNITCECLQCTSLRTQANAQGAIVKSIAQRRLDTPTMGSDHRRNISKRDAQGRILLPPKGRPKGNTTHTQRGKGKPKRFIVTNVRGSFAGSVRGSQWTRGNARVGMWTRDYEGYEDEK